jgi:hypothetical protein
MGQKFKSIKSFREFRKNEVAIASKIVCLHNQVLISAADNEKTSVY